MLVIGFFGARPLPLVIATGAILGSIALLGSNWRTLSEIVAQLKAQEVRRSELIDGLELQPVEGPTSERLMANPAPFARLMRSYEPTSMDGPR
jgi:hypothetical protein